MLEVLQFLALLAVTQPLAILVTSKLGLWLAPQYQNALADLPWWARPSQSLKFARNCEARFFQRPDDAVIRGYDRKAEEDLSRADNFISNFDALPREKAKRMVEKTVSFSDYSPPMRALS